MGSKKNAAMRAKEKRPGQIERLIEVVEKRCHQNEMQHLSRVDTKRLNCKEEFISKLLCMQKRQWINVN
jgi:type II secretory pathway component PulJ